MKNCQPRATLIAASLCQSRHNTGMSKPKRHPRIGSDFEAFLRDEGRLGEATAVAIKRVLAWKIQRAMDSAGVSQAELARRMKTSRAVVRRLLDDSDPSVTLATISRAAVALGKQIAFTLATGTAHAQTPENRRVPKPVRLRGRRPLNLREIESAIASRQRLVAKARGRAALTEAQALRLATAETRAARRA
jgi:transcriptional regulator with XRE-family HTH domain